MPPSTSSPKSNGCVVGPLENDPRCWPEHFAEGRKRKRRREPRDVNSEIEHASGQLPAWFGIVTNRLRNSRNPLHNGRARRSRNRSRGGSVIYRVPTASSAEVETRHIIDSKHIPRPLHCCNLEAVTSTTIYLLTGGIPPIAPTATASFSQRKPGNRLTWNLNPCFAQNSSLMSYAALSGQVEDCLTTLM